VGAVFGDVIERLRRSTVQVGRGGSGVIWSSDGKIVTNAHVLEGIGESIGKVSAVEVELWDCRRLRGEIARRDRRRDLAVLRVEASGLPAGVVGDSNELRVGEFVIAVGNPLGFIGAASTGVVHKTNDRSWVVSQLRLAPGNSGGPLANVRGEVVGINTMIAGGLAFAIPSQTVNRFLAVPQEEHGGLGVVVRPVWLDRAVQQIGLMVLEVMPHSPADRASLLQGDILVGARGRRFRSIQDLEIAIDSSRGGILELQFRRGANANIRTVAAQMAAGTAKAA
jgi:serine protease Do